MATPAPAKPAATPPPAAPNPPAPSPAPAGASPSKEVDAAFDAAFEGSEPPPAPSGGTLPPKPAAGSPPPAPSGGTPQPKAEDFEDVEGVQVPKKLNVGSLNKDFRVWGLNGYKKASELEKKVTELSDFRTKFEELNAIVPKTQQEKKDLEAKYQKLEKEYGDVMGEFKILKYEASPEYREKYQKPYSDAAQRALSEIKELLVTIPDPNGEMEGDKPKMVERAATEADFELIFSQPLGKATKLANEMFGAAASIVLGHRQKLKELAGAAVQAVAEYKQKRVQLEKEQNDRITSERGQVESLWTDINNKLSNDERGKSLWGEVPSTDPNAATLNEALKKGFALADRRFSADFESLPIKDRVLLDATIRHRVAASYLQSAKNKILAAENAQLKKDLEELRDSGGGAPRPHGGSAPAAEGDGATAEFDKKF